MPLHDVSGGGVGAADWADYTPALTASSSNPTLGTGGDIDGRYVQIGKTVIVRIRVLFGSSGTSAGSGTYRISVPVTPANTPIANPGIGHCMLFDSGANFYMGWVQWDSANSVAIFYVDNALTATTHNGPFAWAANDQMHFHLLYEAA